MRGKLIAGGAAAGMLALVPAALAAISPPVRGGRYSGTTRFSSAAAARHAVTLTVTRSGANFSRGRFEFVLAGQPGPGACAGPTYITLSPTRSRQIARSGSFRLRGSFTLLAPISGGKPVPYATTVSIDGAFTDHGRRVSGTLSEIARGHAMTCRSGTVRFSARLRPPA